MEGWLLDIYPSEEDKLTVWLKDSAGRAHAFKKDYRPSFYIHCAPRKLRKFGVKLRKIEGVQDWSVEKRRVKLRDLNKSKVLRVKCKSMKKLPQIVRELDELENSEEYDLYNVDVPYSQAYLHEGDLFPLAKVQLSDVFNPVLKSIDSVRDTKYDLPPLTFVEICVKSKSCQLRESFECPIGEISLKAGEQEAKIREGDEIGKILELADIIREINPDVILTDGGDSWDLPYLAKRSEINEISEELIIDREKKPLKARQGGGTSYFSYGRVYYRPPSYYLRGRIHIDRKNSFIYGECGFQGLVELSRVTRTPLQRTARSSIGSAMTNLQLYQAQKDGILIPWRKSDPEYFKSARKLLDADKGGLIYDPKIGIHEDVGEIDFSSFYPATMEKYNVSPETVLCDCCPDSKNTVPELEYNICERRRGLIPLVLKPVLEKRGKYKKLARRSKDPDMGGTYNDRQEALKWILVTCFGYLGYRNAKFGRIEAHEAVTAFARRNLQRAMRIVEEEGFEVVHGIVDSLWIKKEGIESSELKSLCDRVGDEIGLPISPEGKYRWIVFPSSKKRANVPVMNRYYGIFENGEIKCRGIAARRSDTPLIVKKAQGGMLKELSEAKNAKEFGEKIRDALSLLEGYSNRIKRGDVAVKEITIRKKLSRDPGSYKARARSAVAAEQLTEAGFELHAGQQVAYLVTNADADNPRRRVRPIQLLRGDINYDIDWYLDRLSDAAEELFKPFGYTRQSIRSNLIQRGRQTRLEEGVGNSQP